MGKRKQARKGNSDKKENRRVPGAGREKEVPAKSPLRAVWGSVVRRTRGNEQWPQSRGPLQRECHFQVGGCKERSSG